MLKEKKRIEQKFHVKSVVDLSSLVDDLIHTVQRSVRLIKRVRKELENG